MATMYFWSGTKILEVETRIHTSNVEHLGLLNLFCIDGNHRQLPLRYGKFVSIDDYVDWVYHTLPELPPQLQALDLLLPKP